MLNRDGLARIIFDAMVAKANEIEPGHTGDIGWDDDCEEAENGRECFRAAADAVLVAVQVDNTHQIA